MTIPPGLTMDTQRYIVRMLFILLQLDHNSGIYVLYICLSFQFMNPGICTMVQFFISHYPTLLVANIRSHNLTRFFVFIAHKNQQYLYFIFCLLLYSIFKLLFLSHKQLFLNLVFHLTSRTMFPNYALIMIQYIYTSFILPDSIDKAYLYRHHVLTGFVLFYLHTVHSAET